MKLPQNVAFLERYIRRMFTIERDAYRMRVSMANVVLAQMLPGGVVRGGTSMNLRYGPDKSRFTMDFDTAQQGDVDLQLIAKNSRIPYKKAGLICRRLFAYRQQQPWPSNVAYGSEWETLYAESATGMDVLPSLDEAVPWGNEFIAKLYRYSKAGSGRRG